MPSPQPNDPHYTADGKEITPNMRVHVPDGRGGTVLPYQFTTNDPYASPSGAYFQGWYWVELDCDRAGDHTKSPMNRFRGVDMIAVTD